jgi:hypothetical protein
MTPSISNGTTYHLYVGIDIAAKTFTASWMTPEGRPSPALSFEQSPAGFAALQEHLQTTGVAPAATLVVLEATSSYWVALAVTLHSTGYAVSVVNPTKVHNYAKSLPRRSKTDRLDAQLLAQFAAERRPETWTPPPAIYHELRQRLMTRDGLLEMRKQARNQLHALLLVARGRSRRPPAVGGRDRDIGRTNPCPGWGHRGGAGYGGLGCIGTAAGKYSWNRTAYCRVDLGHNRAFQLVSDARSSGWVCGVEPAGGEFRHEPAATSSNWAWRQPAIANSAVPGGGECDPT